MLKKTHDYISTTFGELEVGDMVVERTEKLEF